MISLQTHDSQTYAVASSGVIPTFIHFNGNKSRHRERMSNYLEKLHTDQFKLPPYIGVFSLCTKNINLNNQLLYKHTQKYGNFVNWLGTDTLIKRYNNVHKFKNWHKALKETNYEYYLFLDSDILVNHAFELDMLTKEHVIIGAEKNFWYNSYINKQKIKEYYNDTYINSGLVLGHRKVLEEVMDELAKHQDSFRCDQALWLHEVACQDLPVKLDEDNKLMYCLFKQG